MTKIFTQRFTLSTTTESWNWKSLSVVHDSYEYLITRTARHYRECGSELVEPVKLFGFPMILTFSG